MYNLWVPTKFEDNTATRFKEEVIDKTSIHSNYIWPVLNPLGTEARLIESTAFLSVLWVQMRPERAEESCWPGAFTSW